jgi:undecaprenyl diphosphate synthase
MIESTESTKVSPIIEKIPKDKFPSHVLIIPDGNGRWANRQNMHPSFGHIKGAEVLSEILDYMQGLPIRFVSVWGFASDNWKRPAEEVQSLMEIFNRRLTTMLPKLIQNNVQFVHLGRKDRIPNYLRETIRITEDSTKINTAQVFSIAIDFGGEDQLIRMMRAVRNLPKDIEITAEVVGKLRDGNGKIPPADLIIRTSGEQRTSDIGWLGINSEFYSIKKLLPDSEIEDFTQALLDFSQRERRFGRRPQTSTFNRMI